MKEVYESANRSVSNPIKMNIVIQIMVKPRISGVCFSDSFDERGQKICLISFVKGLANKLVDGRTTATNVFYKIKIIKSVILITWCGECYIGKAVI